MSTTRKRRASRKETIFARVYAETGNATLAARQAGYKHPRSVGSRVKEQPQVRVEIEERFKDLAEHGFDKATVCKTLGELIRATALVKVGGKLVSRPDNPTRARMGELGAKIYGYTRDDRALAEAAAAWGEIMGPIVAEFVPEERRPELAARIAEVMRKLGVEA